MGSYADLRIGDLTLASTNEMADPTLLMFFSEADKRTYEVVESAIDSETDNGDPTSANLQDPTEAETITNVEYVASLAVVKDRLEFTGFTLPLVRREFGAGVEEHLHVLARRRQDPSWNTHDFLRHAIEMEEQVLSQMSLDSWLKDFAFIIQRKLNPDRRLWYVEGRDTELPLAVRFLLGSSDEGIWFPTSDFRAFMRAAVEVTGTDAQVIYDISDLVADGYVNRDDDLCGWARRVTADEFMLNHKVIVLTEGTSDSWAIEGALRVLYPHLTDYYSFMDFEGVRAHGGAAALVATVKSFVGAGIVNRMIAVFDNDTAARSALRGLRDVRLPNNVRVIHYPDLEWAREYPTLGPQGVTYMDVNGLAGGLELYFGMDVLRQPDGALTAVQWRGYDDALGQYQGELMNKAELKARFAMKLKHCQDKPSTSGQCDWSGMQLVVDRLRRAFHDD